MPRDEDPGQAPTLASSDTIADTLAEDRKSSGTLAGVGGAAGAAASPPTPSSTPPPRLSIPQYELGELLGRGGMGDVLLARDKIIGRDIAIKQLRTGSDDEAIARFLREAKIQARLEHPAIPPVHQIGRDENGQPYFTMKRLQGTTFAEQLALATPPPRQRLLRWFEEACSAVELAHSRGVIHRDLKPSNIMVGGFNEVYVLDWGLARVEGEGTAVDRARALGEDVDSLDGMTQAGAMMGTPGYMAPEQIDDASKAGRAADVYALGAILFELLAREPLHPRGRGAIASTLKGIESGPRDRAPQENVPPELDALCVACLAQNPADRPTVKSLAERLEAYLDGDRDVERRRDLVNAYLRDAHAALAAGNRIDAGRIASSALALDPECIAAHDVIARVTFEQSKEIPPELKSVLTAGEVAVQKRQGRAAMGSFVVVMIYLVVAATNGVDNLPFVVGMVAYLLGHAAIVWRITQRPATPNQMLYVAFGNSLLAALLSRTLGSMIVVPAVTCIMALSLTSYPQLIDRRWAVIAFLVASWIAPVILEHFGVLQRTWEVAGDRVILTSHVMGIGGLHTAILLVASNIATFVVFGLFASAVATSRRDAMQRAEAQAWHLQQMLPSLAGSRPGVK